MTFLVAILVSILVAFAIGAAWGVCIERDRADRFQTLADRLPVARLTRRQRRNLAATRADLRAALRRAS